MADEFDDRGEPVMTAEPPQMQGPPMPQPVAPPAPVAGPGQPPMPPAPPQDPGLFKTQYGDVHVPVPGSGPSEGQMAENLRYMEDMGKIGKIKQAEADVSSAMRFLGMRGMERDISSGVPNHVALAKNMQYLTWGHPEHIPAYMKAIESAQPKPFGPVQAQSVLDPISKQPVEGAYAVPGVHGGAVVHTRPKPQAEMSAAQERLYLKDNIRYKEAAIQQAKDDLISVPSKDKPAQAAAKAKISALQADMDALKAKSEAKSATTAKAAPTATEGHLPLPPKKEHLVKGKTYQTSRGPATWDGDKFVKVK